MKILIAEDDTPSRTALSSLLKKKGFTVIAAKNGTEAWNFLQRADSPRIAILDWLMPGIDGEQLCKMIRENQFETPIYIIMLTVKKEKKEIVEGLESGADDYLSKPYDIGELVARINVGKRILDLETKLTDKISALKINEAKFETFLAEKNLLLYEVHHRIKNNMNTIINLLTIQSEAISNEEASLALRNAAGRVKSMGILYDKLYRSENLSAMSVKKYIPPLIDEIIGLFPERYKVQLDLNIDDFILDVQSMSCVGIILNELVFNSMKYAFTDRETGTISVTAQKTGKITTIIYEDDGCGLPADISMENPASFGLKLIKGISGQINGTIKISPASGTKFILEFKGNPEITL